MSPNLKFGDFHYSKLPAGRGTTLLLLPFTKRTEASLRSFIRSEARTESAVEAETAENLTMKAPIWIFLFLFSLRVASITLLEDSEDSAPFSSPTSAARSSLQSSELYELLQTAREHR